MWLQVNQGKVSDFSRVNCFFSNNTSSIGPPILDNTTCTVVSGKSRAMVESQAMNDYLSVLLIAMCLFLSSVVIMCGAFYYRRELRVWIYSRCGLRMCYKTTSFEEQQDKDRLFDAYVCYSVKDEAFVHQVLAQGLEGGEPNYRLCLHYRDFNVSTYVADTIIEAVESSRRTILVLSKNFLYNEWCRFEFKSALNEVLKDRRRRLIFIVTGEIPQRDLDPDLRLYIKTNIVIEWGDRQFWQKLQFEMPDVKRSCVHQRSAVNIYATNTPMHLERSRSPALPPPPPPGKLPPFLQNPPSLPRNSRPLPHPLWA
ncbi:toll-like receptor Tollo [Agrilus planipennis]|uniref:Toll-like receptor Tollo n=1 Tax=Agrilus planipennis TaxID=224129 RepID=A0A7F5RKV5_AGRPL|nr:toll-like receptor Tollo [Agrilus planipennis]